MSNFKDLCEVDLNDYTKDINGLTYMSWARAWEELVKRCPDATYEHHDWQTFPSGEVMCYCTVTANGVSHKAHLPVRNGIQPVKNPNLMQINKTMQRCFTKAIAMHGLGLYIYRGEDYPTEEEVNPYLIAIDLIDDPVAFHEFVHNLDEEGQGKAFNGAPQGEKSKFKEKWRVTIADANQKFDEYVDFLREGVAEQDANKVYDLVSDFTPYESSVVWARLSESQKQNLEKLLETIDE